MVTRVNSASKTGELIVGAVLVVCAVLLFALTYKLALAAGWILFFFGTLLIVFWLGARTRGRAQTGMARLVFLAPAAILLFVGLVVPAVLTTFGSFQDANGKKFVGFENYIWTFTTPDNWVFLRNTFLWIVITPIFSTALGFFLALLMDRMKRESVPKSLIFMPMAISFVGASIIWGLVYQYRDPSVSPDQVGLLSAVVMKLGWANPPNWILWDPWNNFLLIIIMIWIQTGFALVVLSAAIKAIPMDVTEAAMLDGAVGWKLLTKVTVPMIRGTLVVVLTTIAIGVLKVFDIVRTMTNGNFGTQVLANEIYAQSFVQFDKGRGSALAVILFVAVIPLIVYNIVQLRKEQSIR